MFRRQKGKDYKLVVIKCKLATIVRRNVRNLVIPLIAEKSVLATKICALGSLLFLNKVQAAFDSGIETDFFGQKGVDVIRSCFLSVTYNKKNKLTVPAELRSATRNLERDGFLPIEWPNNDFFGNITGFLSDTYCTNVTTNLNTHLKKRLREFLRMRIYKSNELRRNNPNVTMYDDVDISNTIDLAVGEEDGVTNQDRREKRENLMNMIRDASWYEIRNDNVMEFTRDHWLMSIPMWLTMQREIAQFNTDAGYREQRRDQRQEVRKQRRQKNRKTKKHEKSDDNKPPFIKNLTVIPICSFLRTHIMIGNFELYKMFCETECIPKDQQGKQIESTEITRFKTHYWNQWFDLTKIVRMATRQKQFHYEIVTDGKSVSILYERKKGAGTGATMTKEEIIQKYLRGEFIYEVGIDPGMKTWNASVRRTIATGKEVRPCT